MTDPHSEVLGPLALGALDPVERRRAERHVASCTACAAELAALQAVVRRLDAAGPDVAPPLDAPPPGPALADAVLARVAAGRQADDLARRRAARRATRRQSWLAGVAAAAVLVGGVATVRAGRPEPGPPTETVAVAATQGVRASAELIDHTWGVEIVLTATGLGAGEPYAVEVRDRDGRYVSAGAFVGTGARRMVCRLNAAVLRADATGLRVRTVGGASPDAVVVSASLPSRG